MKKVIKVKIINILVIILLVNAYIACMLYGISEKKKSKNQNRKTRLHMHKTDAYFYGLDRYRIIQIGNNPRKEYYNNCQDPIVIAPGWPSANSYNNNYWKHINDSFFFILRTCTHIIRQNNITCFYNVNNNTDFFCFMFSFESHQAVPFDITITVYRPRIPLILS